MPKDNFWKDKKVLITGHTGFKGAWLALWLEYLGAQVIGFSIDVPTKPALFKLIKYKNLKTVWADVRNIKLLTKTIKRYKPEIIFHLAAQPLVRSSYRLAKETFEINAMGTANVLEAIKNTSSVRAAVMITTDKVYANLESRHAVYREGDALGGYDPYSASKAAAELVIDSYRNSFFNVAEYKKSHQVLIASARAGNVIGGGDFALDRLVPDCICSALKNESILIRNPNATRPWQYVLDPLYGYLLLGEKLLQGKKEFATAWNFGPRLSDAKPVKWMVAEFCKLWGQGLGMQVSRGNHPHEAGFLKLNSQKAKKLLGWESRWDIKTSLKHTVTWAKLFEARASIKEICMDQIEEYMQSGDKK